MMRHLLILGTLVLILGTAAQAADYTFGGDTTGTTQIQRTDSSYVVDTVTSPNATGGLDSAVIWLNANYAGPHSVAIVVYANDSTVLDSTAHFAVSTNALTRYKADFINGGSIAALTRYFIGIHLASTGGTNGAIKIGCNTAMTPRWWYKEAQAVIPATITAPSTTSGYAIAIMLYYSSAPPSAATKKLGKGKLGVSKW